MTMISYLGMDIYTELQYEACRDLMKEFGRNLIEMPTKLSMFEYMNKVCSILNKCSEISRN